MDKPAFSAWLSRLEQLFPSQWQQLHRRIEQADTSAVDHLLEAQALTRCPHCDAARLIRWGSAHDLPRYRCKVCGRLQCPYGFPLGPPSTTLPLATVYPGFDRWGDDLPGRQAVRDPSKYGFAVAASIPGGTRAAASHSGARHCGGG